MPVSTFLQDKRGNFQASKCQEASTQFLSVQLFRNPLFFALIFSFLFLVVAFWSLWRLWILSTYSITTSSNCLFWNAGYMPTNWYFRSTVSIEGKNARKNNWSSTGWCSIWRRKPCSPKMLQWGGRKTLHRIFLNFKVVTNHIMICESFD